MILQIIAIDHVAIENGNIAATSAAIVFPIVQL
jgi:hypothetical protein